MSDLSALRRWFRSEWQAEMTPRLHVHLLDEGGAPRWAERFRLLIEATSDEAPIPGSLPLRYHLRRMARSGTQGERRARFLFVMACQEFSVTDAAREVSPAGWDDHGEQWAVAYAEKALKELWSRCHDPERNDREGPRRFLPHKSESQYRAEEAGRTLPATA